MIKFIVFTSVIILVKNVAAQDSLQSYNLSDPIWNKINAAEKNTMVSSPK